MHVIIVMMSLKSKRKEKKKRKKRMFGQSTYSPTEANDYDTDNKHY